jgi:hypothetical protein
MEMNAQALKLLQDTAVQSEAAVKLDLPGDGRTEYFSQGGVVREINIKPANRKHTFRRLDDLMDMATLYAENDGHPVIWHDQGQVTLILDDQDRRDVGKFPLEVTPQFRAIAALEQNPNWLTQKELVRLLRVTLQLDAAAIAVFRRIDWSSSSTGQGTVERGRESLGRSIEQQVKGAQEIPEFINVPLPIYRNVGEDEIYSVRLLVDFDIEAAKIQIIPAPGELDHILHAHQMNIRRRLEDTLQADGKKLLVPVYFGTP